MKKWIALLIAAALLLGITAGFAEDDAVKEAEKTMQALQETFGAPRVVDVEMESIDEVNARYMYVGYKQLGADLCLVLRFSDTQVYFWALSLTEENFTKAKQLLLAEDAPLCSIQYYENGELKINGAYYKLVSSMLPYDKFMEDVDQVERTVFPGITGRSGGNDKDTSNADPVLSLFPGIKWGMSSDEVMSISEKGLFTSTVTSEGSTLMARPNLFGKTTMVLLTFAGEDKLDLIMVPAGKENMDLFKSAYTLAYGTPHRTTLTGALMVKWSGKILDDAQGDYYAWTTRDTLIMINDSMIQYWPLAN